MSGSTIKPILFNEKMVKALLSGQKTQTRRIVKPATPYKAGEYMQGQGLWIDFSTDNLDHCGHVKDYSVSPIWTPVSSYIKRYAPYKVDDLLYVRESWEIEDGEVIYRAGSHKKDQKWKPSIHMPKEYARIWLHVLDVKMERLQEISIEDAIKEGSVVGLTQDELASVSVLNRFTDIWNSTISDKDQKYYGFDANPFVWVITFEKVEPLQKYESGDYNIGDIVYTDFGTRYKIIDLGTKEIPVKLKYMDGRKAGMFDYIEDASWLYK